MLFSGHMLQLNIVQIRICLDEMFPAAGTRLQAGVKFTECDGDANVDNRCKLRLGVGEGGGSAEVLGIELSWQVS